MNTETQNKDLSSLTIDDLQAELNKRTENERKKHQLQREAYEDMKEDVVMSLVAIAEAQHAQLKEFKLHAFESMQTLYALLLEYSSRHADTKGNFRVEFGNCRVNYVKKGIATFDEKADQAEKHIIDFINTQFAEQEDSRDLIMSLLERTKGSLDVNSIQKLYAMEDRFTDPNWVKGIELLKESYNYSYSKDYIRFEKRDEKGEWKTINLQFSSI